MSIEPNDAKVTAYVLGELSDQQRAAIETQLESSVELGQVVGETQRAADTLHVELQAEPCPRLLDHHRAAIEHQISAQSTTQAVQSAVSISATQAARAFAFYVAVAASAVIAGSAGYLIWQAVDDRSGSQTATQGDDQKPRRQAAKGGSNVPSPAGDDYPDHSPHITLRVGGKAAVRVVAVTETGEEIELDPDLLNWHKRPLAEHVGFDADTFELHGLRRTDKPQDLAVQFGDHTAGAKVEVIGGPPDSATADGWFDRGPILPRGHVFSLGQDLEGAVLAGRTGVVVRRVPPESPLAKVIRPGMVIDKINDQSLVNLTPDEIQQHFRNHLLGEGDVLEVRDRHGPRRRIRIPEVALRFDVQVTSVRPTALSDTSFRAEVSLQVRERAEYRVIDSDGTPLSVWVALRPHEQARIKAGPIQRNAEERYELTIQRKKGSVIRRFPVPPFQLELE